MAHQFWNFCVHVDQTVGEFNRVRSGVANAVDAIDCRYAQQHVSKIGRAAVRFFTAPRVDVLPQQIYLAHALCGEVGNFHQHIRQRPAHFFAARVRHDTKCAVFIAAFHDGHKRRNAVCFRQWQAIKLFNFRKTNIDNGGFTVGMRTALVDHFRQAMQCLRTKNQIHKRCALGNALSFLARHTTADTDNQFRPIFFQIFPAPQLVKHFLLRFFTNGAGVEQNDIGFGWIIGQLQVVAVGQQLPHATGVVLVHLTAVGFNIQFAHKQLARKNGAIR